MPARSVMQVVRLSFGGSTACSTCTYTHVYCIVATLSYGPHEIRPHVMTVCCRTCTNIIMIRWSNAREAYIVCVLAEKNQQDTRSAALTSPGQCWDQEWPRHHSSYGLPLTFLVKQHYETSPPNLFLPEVLSAIFKTNCWSILKQ